MELQIFNMIVSLKLNLWVMMLLQFHPLVNSQAPTSGCDAISDEGTCYSYFTSSINWQNARDMCLAWGGDLATVTSLEENTLMYNTVTAADGCWIGLNDVDNENTFVWADGSVSTYRRWNSGEPNDYGGNEDCVVFWWNQFWNDFICEYTLGCYLCSATVSPFGEQINGNKFVALKDNSLLNTNATLYCITETKNTPQVTWTFEDTNGVSTSLSAMTDATTGVSTLSVTNDKAGYYSCEVSQNGGNTRTYTVEMLDFNLGEPVLTLLYYGCGNSFSLLPPAINRADIPILTQNVSLTTNLVGRWQPPDGSYVNSDSITIPTLYMSHAGLYKLYVTNWNGDWTLAIQIYISSVGSSFGKQIDSSTFTPLSDNSILISNTTLYCITDSNNTPEVGWSYEDISGNRTDLSATTDPSTGVSTLSVTTDVPGYYSCKVFLEGGTNRTYTVETMDISQYRVAENTESYQYTLGVDTEDVFLFCHNVDKSVQLSDIQWRRQGRIGFFPNPLDVHRLGYLLQQANTHSMECFDSESDNVIINVPLNVQGPPVITLYNKFYTTFSLLPSAVNRADIPILTHNVSLTTNLVGRWQTPDGSYVNSDFITIPTLYVSHAGLYKFYVTNWNGDWTLAIQIYISPVGSSFGKQIGSSTFTALSDNSILISNTTLYCITDISNTPEVEWSYEDVSGNSTDLSATTDASTGVSSLSVTTDIPGYYSCKVSLEGGTNRTYTVEMMDISQYTVAENTESYQYTLGVDTEDAFLFCHTVDESVQLSDIQWRRQGRIGFFPNPLDVHRLGYLLQLTNTHPMECFDSESDNVIINVPLNVQGPPVITLYNKFYTTFSLLPPAVNRADIPILTQNVSLSTNLVGRWQTPDGSYVNSDSITIPTLYVSYAGLYKFYVTNWNGDWTLAIQIYISPVGSSFGKKIGSSTFTTLSDNSILISNTTLYCITDISSTPEVEWSYEDVSGNRTELSATTDASTGVSSLSVTTDIPAYYSCLVSLEGGTNRTYSVEMMDISQYTVVETTESYQYTLGVDTEDVFLFCHNVDESVQLSDIQWRRQGRIGFFPNPLDVHRLGFLLQQTNTHPMECFDSESDNVIINVPLIIQGPPIITQCNKSYTTFSLLPPAVNRADSPILTQNVSLSTNLVGRWQIPDGSYVNSDSITIPTLYVSHAGLYKFYVTNWNGDWTLAIQIYISPVETYTQTITDLRTESSSKSSIMVKWSLSESNSYDSEGTFSVYYGFGNVDILAGTTKDLFFEISGLVQNVNYILRVELLYPYSTHIISVTTHHLLALNKSTPYTTVLVIFVILLILAPLMCVLIMCATKRRRSNELNSREHQIQFPQAHANEVYQQVDAINPMAHSNKAFLCTESVEVSKQTEIELDLKMPISVDANTSPNNYAINN